MGAASIITAVDAMVVVVGVVVVVVVVVVVEVVVVVVVVVVSKWLLEMSYTWQLEVPHNQP